MAVREAVKVARDNPAQIIGIKLRIGKHAGGTSGTAPLDLALDAADRAGLPLMCHFYEAPPAYREAVLRLRPGAVLTRRFHHEKDGLPLLPEDTFLLGVCFCDHCRSAAQSAGIDAETARSDWIRPA